MSNSALVTYTRLSPNCSKPRKYKITDIVIHHMAGKLTAKSCGDVFAPSSTGASANYGIGYDCSVGLYVDEANRSWATSNRELDNRAVTIEVSNSSVGGNWPVSDKVIAKLIDLCVDICKRNGIKKLNYTGGKDGNLHMHCWYAATACPGPYLKSKFPYIAAEVNKRLSGSPAASNATAAQKKTATDPAQKKDSSLAGTYVVTPADGLNVRHGAGTGKAKMIAIPKGTEVKCYGYYTVADGVKWLYVQFAYNGTTYTGFCSSKYLKKM